MAAKQLRRRRTGATPALSESAHPIVKIIHRQMIARHTSMLSLAEVSGTDHTNIRLWFKRSTFPSLPLIESVLNALGMEFTVRGPYAKLADALILGCAAAISEKVKHGTKI